MWQTVLCLHSSHIGDIGACTVTVDKAMTFRTPGRDKDTANTPHERHVTRIYAVYLWCDRIKNRLPATHRFQVQVLVRNSMMHSLAFLDPCSSQVKSACRLVKWAIATWRF
jgi:hypothetical protein